MKLLARIIGILFISFFTFLSGLWFTELQRQHNYLAEHGETVEAVVTHVQVTTSSTTRNGKNRSSKKVRPTLSFTNAAGLDQEIVYNGEGLAKDIAVGDVKTLRYLPANPGMHVIMEFWPRWAFRIMAGISLLTGLLCLLFTLRKKSWSRHYEASMRNSNYHPLVGFMVFGIGGLIFGLGAYYFNQTFENIQKNSTVTTGVVTGFQAPADGKGRYDMNVRYRDAYERTATAMLDGSQQPRLSMRGEHPYLRAGDRVDLLLPADGGKPFVAVVLKREYPLFLTSLGLGAALFLVSSLSNLFFWIRG